MYSEGRVVIKRVRRQEVNNICIVREEVNNICIVREGLLLRERTRG